MEEAVDRVIGLPKRQPRVGGVRALRGVLQDTGVMELMERERQEELARDQDWRKRWSATPGSS
jgi:hypothetical protein